MPWRTIANGAADSAASLWAAAERLLPALTARGSRPRPAPRDSVAFTAAVIALAAKMAKADGVATEVEAAEFSRCFAVDRRERANVRRLFDLAARDVAGYDSYAATVARLLRDDPVLLGHVFECLFHVAAADGVLHAGEEAFLKTVAAKFGLDEEAYQSVRRLFVVDPADPYRALGLGPAAPDAEVKARHRALVREHHPDALAAHGVPETFRAVAGRKLATINSAYDAIQAERGRRL